MIKYLIIGVIALGLTFLLRATAVELGYESYKDTLGALLNISSIIFAIIGAWIAIIYPRAVGRAFSGKKIDDKVFNEAEADANYLAELVEIVLVSAFVLMLVLSIQFSVPIGREFVSPQILPFTKIAVFFIVTYLTIAQLYAVSRVILANYFFLNELRRKNINAQVDAMHD